MAYASSGGWRSSLVRDKLSLGPDIPFLASQNYTVKRSGATFKAAAGTADANEVQTLASSGASAGTFTLRYGGVSTAALPYTATAAAIQTALQGLSTIGVGNATVTGGPANTTASVITFAGTLAAQDTGLIYIDKSGLTGGSAAAITETTRGAKQGFNIIRRGTFVCPDASNVGYFKAWATGNTVTDTSGFLMESINVDDGDVTAGVLIAGSVLGARVFPQPLAAGILTGIAGRITVQ